MKHRLALSVLLMSGTLLNAQFKDLWNRMVNPEVVVDLVHPPTLGLKVSRVAIVGLQDRDSQDLVAACIADISRSGQVEIVDRANFQSILREQEFGATGYLEPSTIARLGKLAGAAALVTVRVNHCKPSQAQLTDHRSYRNKKGYTETSYNYISKTTVEFIASVQVTDLSTGKIYAAQRISAAPALQNTSDRGFPEYPSELQVRDMAIQRAQIEVHRMLLSWTEQRKLIFFDDKNYGMKNAFIRLELKDYPGALAQSQAALEACKADPKAKPKHVGRANYNLGMSHFILGRYDEAMPFLQAAREADPESTIFKESHGECMRAISLQEEMRKVDARSITDRQAQVSLESAALAHADPVSAPGPEIPSEKAASTKPSGSPEARLEKLTRLYKQSLISKPEYERKKAEILKDL